MTRHSPPKTSLLSERLFRDLATTLEFDRFLLKAAHGAAEAVAADMVGLIFRYGEILRFQFVFSLNPTQKALPDVLQQFSFPRDSGTVGQAMTSGSPLYTPDYATSPFAIQEFVALGIQSDLVVPIPVAGRLEGALVMGWYTRPKHPPENRALALTETIAAFMGSTYYRSTLEAALTHDARHDVLTGLPNRVVLMDRLAHARRRVTRHERLLAIVLLDVDGFKGVNDRLGHEAGDHIIATIAERLGESVRITDTVSRYGGDEFVALIEDIAHLDQLETILDRALSAINQPVPFKGQDIVVSVSAGLTIYPFDDQPTDILLQHADQAMYEAKRAGGNQYRCFERSKTFQLTVRSRLRRDLTSALNEDAWVMSYQPIVDWHGQTVAFEGRLRWPRSDGAKVREEDIGDLLDKPLPIHLFERALAASKRDLCRYLPPGVHLHLNLHEADLANNQILTLLDSWCEETGMGSGLVLELPETTLVANITMSRKLIYQLRERGINVLVDDFNGANQGRLGHLIDIPVSGLKCLLPSDHRQSRLLHGLAAGASAMGLQLYAQSLTSASQRQLAEQIGCLYGQGAFLAPELEANAVRHWLQTTSYRTKHSQ